MLSSPLEALTRELRLRLRGDSSSGGDVPVGDVWSGDWTATLGRSKEVPDAQDMMLSFAGGVGCSGTGRDSAELKRDRVCFSTAEAPPSSRPLK